MTSLAPLGMTAAVYGLTLIPECRMLDSCWPPLTREDTMNWKLILQLSLFGLVMGVGTVFVIPSTIEPFLWLVVFLVSAYLIATRAEAPFVHGVVLGLANSVWVTGAHVLLFSHYVANHPREMAMMQSMPLPTHPRVMMLIMGPVIGLISGIVIGLFAIVAHRLATPRARPVISSS